MNGVNIVSQVEVVAEYAFNWQSFWIDGLSVLVICAIAGFCEYIMITNDIVSIFIGIIMGLIGGALFGATFGVIAQHPIEYTTEYKVIVSDEVNFNEFQEKYKIIDQKGKIYTVRERE